MTISGNVSAGLGCDLSNTTVDGSVTVVPGGSLFIGNGSTGTISGNVTTAASGALEVEILGGTIQGSVTMSGIQFAFLISAGVGGSITVTNVGDVLVSSDTVGGNVTLSGGTASAGEVIGRAEIAASNVHGSVSIHDNNLAGRDGNDIFDYLNTIGGTNQVYDNTVATAGGEAGIIDSHDNRVAGRALFQDNTAASFSISSNTITGNLGCSGNVQAPSGSGNSANRKTGQCAGL